jgi:hypothetical protein
VSGYDGIGRELVLRVSQLAALAMLAVTPSQLSTVSTLPLVAERNTASSAQTLAIICSRGTG